MYVQQKWDLYKIEVMIDRFYVYISAITISIFSDYVQKK